MLARLRRALQAPAMARATRSTAAAVGRRAGGRSVPPAPEAQKQQRRGGAHAAAKRPVAAATPAGGGAATTAASPPAELQAKADRIAKSLAEMYPDPPIPLDHGNTFQFLCAGAPARLPCVQRPQVRATPAANAPRIAVVLSAQSTDKKVNTVTPKLFAAAPTAHAMAELSIDTVKEYIKEIGLANSKAKYLVNLSKQLLELHDGEVPSDFKALEALPGVGHKTASVIMGQAFGIDAFPVDTHIHRLAARWGLSNGTTVERTEADLKVRACERCAYTSRCAWASHCKRRDHRHADARGLPHARPSSPLRVGVTSTCR